LIGTTVPPGEAENVFGLVLFAWSSLATSLIPISFYTLSHSSLNSKYTIMRRDWLDYIEEPFRKFARLSNRGQWAIIFLLWAVAVILMIAGAVLEIALQVLKYL